MKVVLGFFFLVSLVCFQSVEKTLPITNKDRIQNGVKTQSMPPVPVRFEFCLVPSIAYGALERRGAAEPLAYSFIQALAIVPYEVFQE